MHLMFPCVIITQLEVFTSRTQAAVFKNMCFRAVRPTYTHLLFLGTLAINSLGKNMYESL